MDRLVESLKEQLSIKAVDQTQRHSLTHWYHADSCYIFGNYSLTTL